MTTTAVYLVALIQGMPSPHGAADLLVLLVALSAVVTALHGLVFGGRKPGSGVAEGLTRPHLNRVGAAASAGAPIPPGAGGGVGSPPPV